MESAFAIIAEPHRRAILSMLSASERSVSELMQRLRLPQPSVSKHLKVLRDGGFVESRVDAQRRVYRLNPGALQEVDEWLAPFRQLWPKHLDALEPNRERMENRSLVKGKKRRDKRAHCPVTRSSPAAGSGSMQNMQSSSAMGQHRRNHDSKSSSEQHSRLGEDHQENRGARRVAR